MNKFMDFEEEVVLPVGGKTSAPTQTTGTLVVSTAVGSAVPETVVKSATGPDFSEEAQMLSLHEVERNHIMKVLTHTKGNKSEAAKILGITIKSVYNKLHQYETQGHELGVASIGKSK